MKKIVFISLFIFSSFSFASLEDCSCSGYYSEVRLDGVYNTGGSMDDECSPNSFYIYKVDKHDDRPYHDPDVIMTFVYKQDCIPCNEPDTLLEIPEGESFLASISTDDRQIPGGCPIYKEEDIESCLSLGGRPLGHRKNCCEIIDGCYGVPPSPSSCPDTAPNRDDLPLKIENINNSACYMFGDGNGSLPADIAWMALNDPTLGCCYFKPSDTNDTQCPPSLIKNEFGQCVCPPDTFGVVVSPPSGHPYPVCMPNSDCDLDKGQVYTPDGCLCPENMQPDINGTCLSIPPDNNDTNNSDPNDDHPGQIQCPDGHWQLRGIPCSDSEPAGGDGDPNSDCNYPLYSTTHGWIWQGNTASIELCQAASVSLVGSGTPIEYIKNDNCSLGACYYPDSPVSPDNNDTNNSGSGGSDNTNVSGVMGDSNLSLDLSPVTSHLDKIDRSINTNGKKLSDKLSQLHKDNIDNTAAVNSVKSSVDGLGTVMNAMNNSLGGKIDNAKDSLGAKLDKINNSIKNKSLAGSLGSKLDAIKGAIDDKNLSVTVENNITIDLNRTNDLLADINRTLSADIDHDALNSQLNDYYGRIAESDDLFDDAALSISTTIADLQSLVSGATPPTVTYSGSCDLCFSTSFGNNCISLQETALLRPYFQFFLNVVLAFLTIRLWVGIIRDLVKYLIYL